MATLAPIPGSATEDIEAEGLRFLHFLQPSTAGGGTVDVVPW